MTDQAGPFKGDSERKVIEEVMNRLHSERVRDGELRVQALQFAVDIRDMCDSSDTVLDDAEKFHHFLKGGER